MRTFRLICLGYLLFAVNLQGQVHDLELQIDVDAPAVTPPGSTGNLTFTVINHGPDTAGTTGVGLFNILVDAGLLAYSPIHGELMDFDGLSDLSICAVTAQIGDPLPGEPIPILFTIFLDDLPPGESVTCEVGFWINPLAYEIDPRETADDNILHRWTVGSPPGTDPNSSNNRLYMTYLLAPPPSTIPTLSPFGLAVLALGLVAAYAFVRRRASMN